jgi:hypothetical protein
MVSGSSSASFSSLFSRRAAGVGCRGVPPPTGKGAARERGAKVAGPPQSPKKSKGIGKKTLCCFSLTVCVCEREGATGRARCVLRQRHSDSSSRRRRRGPADCPRSDRRGSRRRFPPCFSSPRFLFWGCRHRRMPEPNRLLFDEIICSPHPFSTPPLPRVDINLNSPARKAPVRKKKPPPPSRES